MADEISRVLDKLAKDVVAAVHAVYRGDMRQSTAKVRTSHLVRDADAALRALAPSLPFAAAGAASPRPPVSSPAAAGAAVGWTREEGEAVMKCITAWLPMGPASSAAPDSRCIASGREMVPTWSERERARAALRKLTPA